MADDNLYASFYDECMAKAAAHIIIRIDVERPIDIGDFVSAFTSVASQYDKFIREKHPDLTSEAHIFVSEVRKGSIVADLIPFPIRDLIGGIASIIEPLEQIAVTVEFIKEYGGKLKAFFKSGEKPSVTRADLKDFMGSVAAIANDPHGSASIEAAVFEDKKEKIKAALKFTTPQAKRALEQIEAMKRELEQREHADYERVLMVFTQANTKAPTVGKKTTERVKIEEIAERDLPLVYASELAEQRIKHEIQEADENVFKKGFVVDVNVETIGGRPVAYKVTNIHQVIDLPDEVTTHPLA